MWGRDGVSTDRMSQPSERDENSVTVVEGVEKRYKQCGAIAS